EVGLGDVHHQAQVVLDHLLPGGEISGRRAPREAQLLLRGEQPLEADLVKVELGRVAERFPGRRGGRGPLLGAVRFREIAVVPSLRLLLRSVRVHERFSGRSCRGSTGFPSFLISKVSFAWVESVLPISAIFCPLTTLSPCFTRRLLLCAYVER